MKPILLYFFFFILLSTKHKVEISIVNDHYDLQSAQIKIFKKGVLIQEFDTKGKFTLELEKGMYAIQVIRCTTTYDMFRVVGDGREFIVVEGECSL